MLVFGEFDTSIFDNAQDTQRVRIQSVVESISVLGIPPRCESTSRRVDKTGG